MKAEYKRDMNHNYLILYGEEEINTDSYQVRMLVGNVVPSLLKCRIQGMNGKFMVYFDITSRQAISQLYEEKKMGIEDLRRIFGGFIQVMEDTAEYLMNPGQLLLVPEYIYTDMEKGQIYFCLMPGYSKDIKEQFYALTEYILPKIDHKDSAAVMLGYGVYRRAMENSFHLEYIKEELYKLPEEQGIPKIEKEELFKESQKDKLEENNLQEDSKMEFVRESEKTAAGRSIWKIGLATAVLFLIAAITVAIAAGYLPYLQTGILLGIILLLMGSVMSVSWIMKKREKKPLEDSTTDFLREDSDFLYTKEEQSSSKNINHKKELIYNHAEFAEKEGIQEAFGETVVLSAGVVSGPASFVSREPGELPTIYLQEDLTVVGKLRNACDAVIDLPTVSRIHAKICRRENEYYLTDMNSRNGTTVNGRLLLPDEEYKLQDEDEVDFAQARYIFLE